ncbi:MAG: ComF family protein [Enterococcaceae bacterium]|nr:ComF family protein [Enterococcaceae bacterium]MCI1918730.1 ComF family protein [Enterococcaceae bacterium]
MSCPMCRTRSHPRLTCRSFFGLAPLARDQLCPSCRAAFVFYASGNCPGCGKSGVAEDACPECAYWHMVYPEKTFAHRGLIHYEGAMKEVLQQYKYGGDYRLRQVFSEIIAAALGPLSKKGWQIVPIPSVAAKNQQRGFDPVNALLEAAGIPQTPLLEKMTATAPQAGKSRQERLRLVQPFQLRATLREQPICLFDDVYTTGRTLFHAKDLFWRSGPFWQGTENLISISLAR